MPSAPTVTVLAGSADVAGPLLTSPVAMSNSLPWQAQLMVPSFDARTVQPWWVQTAEKALKSPAVGWVTHDLGGVEDLAAADRDVGLLGEVLRRAEAAPDAASLDGLPRRRCRTP